MKEGSNISGNSKSLNKNKSLDTSDKINIIITGDFCPDRRIEKYCLNGSHDNIYGDILPVLKDKDFSITNLECPLVDIKTPIKKTGPNLIASPKCIRAIKYGGFDAVTLANNHILDHGEEGLAHTLTLCEKENIKTVGVGKNLNETEKPLYINLKGTKIAVLNFAENEFSIAGKTTPGANPLDPIKNFYQIKKAQKTTDIIIVIIHGGHEYYELPSPRMVKTYRFFADLGVTAVIGHHTHCPSGYEVYNNVPIFYSLGNFIFDRQNVQVNSWYEGFFVKLSIGNKQVNDFKIFPYHQYKEKPGVYFMDQREKEKFELKLYRLSSIISNSALLETNWSELCKKNKLYYLYSIFNFNKLQQQLIKRKLYPTFLINKRVIKMINMFKCEAHRDLSIAILNDLMKQ